LYNVTYGAGQFVAVGNAGTIVTSADAMEWTRRVSGSTATLRGVTYGGGRFLAIGTGGAILSSPDAVDWAARDSGTTNDLYAATYGPNLFVAVGANGTITTSGDGAVFNAEEGAIRSLLPLTGVVYGQGTFLGTQDNTQIFGSNNGGVDWWVGDTLIQPIGEIEFSGVVYGNGRFVIVGALFHPIDFLWTSIIVTSTNTFDWDRVDWNIRGDDSIDAILGLRAVAFGRGTFLAVGPFLRFREPPVLSSGDGINWTFHHSETSRSLYGVAYGQRTFVTVGESGTILQSDRIGPRLEPVSKSSLGSFDFSVIVEPGESCRIEASGDLTNWTVLSNFVSTSGTILVSDSSAPTFNRRFYRAVSP